MLQTVCLSHAEAQRAIAAIQAELSDRGKTAVIAVADAHGEVIALLRLDGAPLSSVTIAMNKAWTAARERKPSGDVGAKARTPGAEFDIGYFGDLRFTGWGGGLPVLLPPGDDRRWTVMADPEGNEFCVFDA